MDWEVPLLAGTVLVVMAYSLLVVQNLLFGVSISALLGLVYLFYRLVVAVETIAENTTEAE